MARALGLGLGLPFQAGRGGGGPAVDPTLALDLNFLVGTLDPRVTFTRAGTATYYNSAGVLSTAATNTPRFDHAPVTLAPRGLLIEEQRTNVMLRSGDMAHVAWTKAGAAATSGSLAPDGSTTAISLVEAATTAEHRIYQAAAIAVSVSAAWSIYAKAGTRSWIGLRSNTAGCVANFNLSTGTLGTVKGGTTATIAAVGNGWYRCTMTGTTHASGTDYLLINMGDADTGIGAAYSYTGNGTGNVYLWGTQLEVGGFPTSYIPTTTAAVTRAADSAQMTGTNFSSWHNATEGTFVLDFELAALSVNHLLNINLNTDSERAILTGDGSAYIIDNSVVQMNVSAGTPVLVATNKMALAYKVNDAAASLNGSAPTTDSSCSINSMFQLAIGNGVVGGEIIPRMHARRLRFYNVRKSNAELQALTS